MARMRAASLRVTARRGPGLLIAATLVGALLGTTDVRASGSVVGDVVNASSIASTSVRSSFAKSASAKRSLVSTATSRVKASLPAVEDMRIDAGAAALVDLMLHAPVGMRLALKSPATAHREIQLAPLGILQRSGASLTEQTRVASLSATVLASEPLALSGIKPSQGSGITGVRTVARGLGGGLPLASVLPGAAPKGRRISTPSDEGRVFWYAMGASALTSLGTRVFLFFPALLLAVPLAGLGAVFGPVAMTVLFVGMFGGIAAIDAALAALAGAFVFDSMSRFYESKFLSGFLGQVLGTGLATAAVGIMVGFGLLYITGLTSLVQFVGADILGVVTALSVLGLMPVVVLGFFASVVVPAVAGAWALSLTASPVEGFAIDPTWDPEPASRIGIPRDVRAPDRRILAPVRVAIPGT